MIQTKKALRQALAEKRDALPRILRHSLSQRIVSHLLNYPQILASKKIALYAPFRSEVDVLPAFEILHARGVKVCFPKIKGSQEPLLFCAVRNLNDLQPGKFGILEPQGELCDVQKLDVIVVPALAYDKRGARLGYGAGFYDRTLSFFKGFKVGLAFKSQVLDKLPYGGHDCLLDDIITEDGSVLNKRDHRAAD